MAVGAGVTLGGGSNVLVSSFINRAELGCAGGVVSECMLQMVNHSSQGETIVTLVQYLYLLFPQRCSIIAGARGPPGFAGGAPR